MEMLLAIMVGLGLSAACGFRVFVPALVAAIALRCGQLQVSSEFAWLGSNIAIIALAIGTLAEICAYFFPFIDNALDAIALPCAVIAGTVLGGAMVSDVAPFLKWSMALIAGGGAAASIHVGMAKVRALSSTTTAGIANPVVAGVEAASSTGMSLLAVFTPVVAGVIALVLVIAAITLIVYVVRLIARKRAKQTA